MSDDLNISDKRINEIDVYDKGRFNLYEDIGVLAEIEKDIILSFILRNINSKKSEEFEQSSTLSFSKIKDDLLENRFNVGQIGNRHNGFSISLGEVTQEVKGEGIFYSPWLIQSVIEEEFGRDIYSQNGINWPSIFEAKKLDHVDLRNLSGDFKGVLGDKSSSICKKLDYLANIAVDSVKVNHGDVIINPLVMALNEKVRSTDKLSQYRPIILGAMLNKPREGTRTMSELISIALDEIGFHEINNYVLRNCCPQAESPVNCAIPSLTLPECLISAEKLGPEYAKVGGYAHAFFENVRQEYKGIIRKAMFNELQPLC